MQAGVGACGALVKSYDWSRTSLGPAERWPQSRTTAVDVILRSPVPIVTLWGADGVMIYNDGYATVAGARHPQILGMPVRDAWPEAAAFNEEVMKVGLDGGTLAFHDQEFMLYRKGQPEQVWLNLHYSPIPDEAGAPAGVIAIVVETTGRVLADRRASEEYTRLTRLFEQAPSFMAMLTGAEHVFELVNPGFQQLIGPREVIGRSLREALPEIADQGFITLLDQVWSSGDAVRRLGMKVLLDRGDREDLTERYVDFVYQPIVDQAGAVSHIFVQGSDVTDRVVGERQQRLLINELNHRVKNTLATVQAVMLQTLRGAVSLEAASATLTDRIIALSRAQDLLTSESWSGAEMRAVVVSAVAALNAEDRIDLVGPALRLDARPALALAMAIHEMTTNAVKYGALSNDGGRVAVVWRVGRDGNERRFELEWRESGGPAVSPPTRRGFGAALIERGLAAEFGAEVSVEYPPEGLRLRLRTSLDAVEQASPDESG